MIRERSPHAHSFSHRSLALAVALCALAGCAVPMQMVDASRAACGAYGFQPGNDAFAECVMAEQHRHTLRIALRPTAAPAVAAPRAPEITPLPAAQPASAAQTRTQFYFGSGAFEQCQ